jgi:23S rRNA pseudouridine2605 synthase
MKLNKFIADAGITSRREAVKLIKDGQISVNGEVETTPGYEVQKNDSVTMNGKRLRVQEKLYLVMNKPNGYITSVEDERGRKTVMDLVTPHVKERVFPVGRLDRDTTGILLLTNDGELTLRLTHPRYNIEKIYVATLDRSLDSVDLARLRKGLKLDDGFMKVDYAGFIDGASSKVVTVTIHSGKNRVVKRLFEHLGYTVVQLHRSKFGPLVLHGIGKGKIRPLTDDELEMLMQVAKMDSESIIKKAIVKPLKTFSNQPRKESKLQVIKPFRSEQTDWRKAEAEEIRHMQESFAAFEDAAKKQKHFASPKHRDSSKKTDSYKRSDSKRSAHTFNDDERSYSSSRFKKDAAPVNAHKQYRRDDSSYESKSWSSKKDRFNDHSRHKDDSNTYDSFKRNRSHNREDRFDNEERSYSSSRFERENAPTRTGKQYRNDDSSFGRYNQSPKNDHYSESKRHVDSSKKYDSYKRNHTLDREDRFNDEERSFNSSPFKRNSTPRRVNRSFDRESSFNPTNRFDKKDRFKEDSRKHDDRPRYAHDKKRSFDSNESYGSNSSSFDKKSSFKRGSSSRSHDRYAEKPTSTRNKRDYKKRTSRSY